jgi:hypothetical protein
MRRVLPWIGLGLIGVAAGSSFACSSDDSGGGSGGTAGSTGGKGGTVITGGSSGTGTGGTGTGGTSATGGSSTGGTGGGPTTRLGRACVNNDECGAGLECVTAASARFNGAGPAGGYCTADCAGDAASCQQFDPDAICLNFGDDANPVNFCMLGCTFGPTSLQQLDPSKCHARGEVACSPLFSPTGTACTTDAQCGADEICGGADGCFAIIPACLPQCNSDVDCGGALKCDPRDGQCRTATPTGKNVGDPCTQMDGGVGEECKGNCTGFVAGTSGDPLTYMCAENCTTGIIPSCGWDGPGSGDATAFCLFASSVLFDRGGPGAGDRGSCGQLCDCNNDCTNPDLICRDAANANFTTATGRQGYCSLPNEDDGGMNPGIPCTGTGGTGGSGTGGSGGTGTGGTGTGGTGGAAGAAGATP